MRRRTGTWCRLAGCLTLMAVVGAACGSSDGSAGGGSVTTAAAADSSVQGVTADAITIGVSYLDFDILVKNGLSPNTWGDQELVMQTFVDDLNERGGINGRKVRAIFEKYDPVGTASAEASCLKLTQDSKVFAVLGGFVGPAEPANTCVVGQQQTILVGGKQSAERLAEAKAPWVQTGSDRARSVQVLLDILDQTGELKGKKIAVVTGLQAQELREDVDAKLAGLGVKPAVELLNDAPSGDIVTEDKNWAVLAERIRGAKADAVLLVGSTSAGIRNIASQGLDVATWVLDSDELANLGKSVDPAVAKGALAAASLSGDAQWDDTTVKPCRDVFAKAHPEIKVTAPNKLEPGEPAWSTAITAQCRDLDLFEKVATKAGKQLDQASFAKAIDTIGSFTLPGSPYASLGPDKFDANDSFQLVRFDPTKGQKGILVAAGKLRDVTP